jgi:hypothetical protein
MAWKEADARTAALEALARLGADMPSLDLLRFGENALYAYPARIGTLDESGARATAWRAH